MTIKRRLQKEILKDVIAFKEPNIRSKIRRKEHKKEIIKRIIQLLKEKGFIQITHLYTVYKIGNINLIYEILNEYSYLFKKIKVYYRGSGKGSVLRGSTFIKERFLGKGFLLLRNDRTTVIRFFNFIFKKKQYKQNEIRRITQFLKKFNLSKAERLAIITRLGYVYHDYSVFGNIKVNGYYDNPITKKHNIY